MSDLKRENSLFPLNNPHRRLLVVEDSDEDFVALTRILKKVGFHNPIDRVCDGDEALDFLYQRGQYADPNNAPSPTLILLDLNLPGVAGVEVLAQVKSDETLKIIPIVALTTSANPKDIEACYRAGVNSYMVKPLDTLKLTELIEGFLAHWFEAAILPGYFS